MSQYDSAANVDEFLSRMRRKPVRDEDVAVQSSLSIEDHAKPEEYQGIVVEDAHQPVAKPPVSPLAVSPAQSPSAPANYIDVYVAGARLPLGNDDTFSMQIAENGDSSISPGGKVFGSHSPKNMSTPRSAPSDGRNMLDVEYTGPEMTPTQIELLAEKNKRNAALMNNIVTSFKTDAETHAQNHTQISPNDGPAPVPVDAGAYFLSPGISAQNENSGNTSPVETANTPGSTHSSIAMQMPDDLKWTDKAGKDSHMPQSLLTEVPYSPTIASNYKPVIIAAGPTLSSNSLTIHQSPPMSPSYRDNVALQRATDHLASKLADVQVETREQQVGVLTSTSTLDGSNRQHAIYFNSWGSPESRSRSKSQIRKIILSGLPPNADYSFVASLIHGGAIESISLNTATKTAQVLFTDGGACHQYYERYPNGIDVKHKGRNLMIFVDKGKDVDIISSMLQGYLNAGASRVVRASHVDEDWSMRALHKIAEGGKCQRRVESIVDSLRNETRTVIFRFANIADAVTFRHTLRRCDDWEAAETGFMSDPCENADSIHFD